MKTPKLAYISLPDAGGTKEHDQKQLNSDQQDRDEEMKMVDQISHGLKYYNKPLTTRSSLKERNLKTQMFVK